MLTYGLFIFNKKSRLSDIVGNAEFTIPIKLAASTLVMLPTLILYILVQKKLTEGMTVGGVKG